MKENQGKFKNFSSILNQNATSNIPENKSDYRFKEVYTSKSLNSTHSNGSKTFRWHLW